SAVLQWEYFLYTFFCEGGKSTKYNANFLYCHPTFYTYHIDTNRNEYRTQRRTENSHQGTRRCVRHHATHTPARRRDRPRQGTFLGDGTHDRRAHSLHRTGVARYAERLARTPARSIPSGSDERNGEPYPRAQPSE